MFLLKDRNWEILYACGKRRLMAVWMEDLDYRMDNPIYRIIHNLPRNSRSSDHMGSLIYWNLGFTVISNWFYLFIL